MKKLRGHKGAAAVEFALVLLPLIILVFGAIEFGVLLYNQQVITNASREGARAGIVQQNPRVDESTIRGIVRHYADAHLITFGTQNSVDIPPMPGYSPTAPSLTQDLTVTVNYTYSFLVIPNFIPGIDNPRTMSATTVMRYE